MIAGITVFVSVLLLVGIAYSGFAMNAAASRMERAQIERELDRTIVALLEQQKSVALWDEAVQRVRARDNNWLDSEIGAYLQGTYGHDEVYVLNGADKLVYAYPFEHGRQQTMLSRLREGVDPLIRDVRHDAMDKLRDRTGPFLATHKLPEEIRGASSLRWSAHLMNVDGRPVILGVMTIVPTTAAKINRARPPLLISAIWLDGSRLAKLGMGVGIERLHLNSGLVPDADSSGSLALDADDGQPIGVLKWVPQHPGHKILVYVLPLLVLGTLWGLYAAAAMLKRMVDLSRNLQRSEEDAQRLACYDELSQLPNRRFFVQALEERLQDWLAGRNVRPLMAYVDLDRFKDVNDTLGHDTGDALICTAAERLRQALPEGHLLARLGGDEFGIVADSADPLAAWKIGRALCEAFTVPIQANEHELVMTASIGIAIAEGQDVNVASLMRQADIALYRAKEAGRSRAVIFREEMARAIERRHQIEIDLRAALTNDELRLVYQPVLTIAGKPRFDSVEALLRWEHPERGLISPEEFIPVAEASGQMAALGQWVIGQALKDGARWPGLRIAVNLSPVQLKVDGFVRNLNRRMAEAHVSPKQIILEVTESVMMDASGLAGQALKDLRGLGFEIALDDFGTGYSSLSYLRQFHFDRLKIDRRFIEDVGEDEEALAVIEMVVALGLRLGLDVVAEGIENEKQAQMMKQVGCTHLQGWFVAKPLEVADVDKMMNVNPRVESIQRMLGGSAA